MNWWEEMALHVVLGVVSAVVKNPAKKAALQQILLHLADTIYATYGMTATGAPPASSANPPILP